MSQGGLRINREQTIASFFSRVFPHPIKVKLRRNEEDETPGPFAKVSAERIAISQGAEPDLHISLMRTIRIPEDNREYDLPPEMGHFPVFDIQPFSKKFPVSMAAQGGVFIPMHRK
jgi:hypothetical protein